MKYPMTFLSDAAEYVTGRRSGVLTSDADLHPKHREVPWEDDPQDVVDAAVDKLLEHWSDKKNGISAKRKDDFEGTLSIDLYKALSKLPATVLTDRDFWRYLAARMYDFIQWRDGESCSLESYGASAAALNWNCVPLRMFNRAHVAEVGRLAAGSTEEFYGVDLHEATDLWRSHILRVLTSYAPLVAYSMLKDYDNWTARSKGLGRGRTEVVRQYAKDLRRTRSNILFEVLDQDAVDSLLASQTIRTIESLAAEKS